MEDAEPKIESLENAVHRAPIPLDGVNLVLDQLRQTAVNVVAEPADGQSGEVAVGIGHRLAADQADHKRVGGQFSLGDGFDKETVTSRKLLKGSVREPPDNLGADSISTPGEITERREADVALLDVHVPTAIKTKFHPAAPDLRNPAWFGGCAMR